MTLSTAFCRPLSENHIGICAHLVADLLLFTISDDRSFPGGSVVKNSPAKQEAQVRSLAREDLLEEKTATHCSILAWKIPWTDQPGRLQSMGSQRVRHNLVTKQQQQKEVMGGSCCAGQECPIPGPQTGTSHGLLGTGLHNRR